MIVVHKYISRGDRRSKVAGKSPKIAALGRAIAHVKYIQHRPGEDREDGGREFFDEGGENFDAKELRQLLKKTADSRILIHTLTLAPEINLRDKRALAMEVMRKLGDEKGLDLEWYAVEHNNTDHYHVHVVLLGKDKNGKEVRINKEDYKKIRDFGDAYLERWHPLELDYSRSEREKAKEAQSRDLAAAKERARQERIRDGLELPWLHKKIIREQYEPYSKWKRKQNEKKKERQKKKDKGEGERSRSKDTIEAAEKVWSKDNSLKELRDLNQHLWDNYGDRIDHKSYCKLVAWIKEKEEIERGEKAPPSEKKKGKEPDREKKGKDKDYFEYDSKKYSEKSSYDDLRGLLNKIHEPKAKRLSIDDYQSLREWMEDADRARWQGVLNKQIELGKERYAKKGFQDNHPNNFRAPMGPGAGKMTAMFGTIAYVGRLAYEMVRIFDFSMDQVSDGGDRAATDSVLHHNFSRFYTGPR